MLQAPALPFLIMIDTSQQSNQHDVENLRLCFANDALFETAPENIMC